MTRRVDSGDAPTALRREVGIATEMLLTKAEQVSDARACGAGLRLREPPDFVAGSH
jgi:hypothetical protein